VTSTRAVESVEWTDDALLLTWRYQLWAALPDDDRVTVDDVRDASMYELTRRSLLEAFDRADRGCAVAIRATTPFSTKKWVPCHGLTAEGSRLCAIHGGPSARQKPPTDAQRRISELEAENASLRAQVQARSR
jgi:hypothetical protein